MTKQVLEYIILKSDNFIFKVPHPDLLITEKLNTNDKSLFHELTLIEFNHSSEVILFKSADGQIGVIGEEFTSWYPGKEPSLSIKRINTNIINEISLLNMKPARGSGFCTISFPPDSKELIFIMFMGSDRNWDFNFKKLEKYLQDFKNFLNCNNINIIENYNC